MNTGSFNFAWENLQWTDLRTFFFGNSSFHLSNSSSNWIHSLANSHPPTGLQPAANCCCIAVRHISSWTHLLWLYLSGMLEPWCQWPNFSIVVLSTSSCVAAVIKKCFNPCIEYSACTVIRFNSFINIWWYIISISLYSAGYFPHSEPPLRRLSVMQSLQSKTHLSNATTQGVIQSVPLSPIHGIANCTQHLWFFIRDSPVEASFVRCMFWVRWQSLPRHEHITAKQNKPQKTWTMIDRPSLLLVHCSKAQTISTESIFPSLTFGGTTSLRQLFLICARTIGSWHHCGVSQHLSIHFRDANATLAPVFVASLHCFKYAATN